MSSEPRAGIFHVPVETVVVLEKYAKIHGVAPAILVGNAITLLKYMTDLCQAGGKVYFQDPVTEEFQEVEILNPWRKIEQND